MQQKTGPVGGLAQFSRPVSGGRISHRQSIDKDQE
jgi:hypothetical protein